MVWDPRNMTTLAEIEIAAAALPPADKRALLDWLKSEVTTEDSGRTQGPRTSGLGKGAWWVADDFDAPLPESFWLGQDA